jgi:glutaminase
LCASSLDTARRMDTTTTTHIQETLQNVYEKYKDVRDGEVASYIPELAKAKPDDFGITLATVDGQVFSVGDSQREFTIQSICKPFAFLMALEEFGRDAVLQKVCVEPSGDAFNSIELEPKTMRPFNPMINAGAIAIASLIKKSSRDCGVLHFVDKMGRRRAESWISIKPFLFRKRRRAIAIGRSHT